MRITILAKNATIEWLDPKGVCSAIRVVDQSDPNRHFRPMSSTMGACCSGWKGTLDEIQSLAWWLIVECGANPSEVHQAFAKIEEYQEFWTTPVFRKIKGGAA